MLITVYGCGCAVLVYLTGVVYIWSNIANAVWPVLANILEFTSWCYYLGDCLLCRLQLAVDNFILDA